MQRKNSLAEVHGGRSAAAPPWGDRQRVHGGRSAAAPPGEKAHDDHWMEDHAHQVKARALRLELKDMVTGLS